MVTMASSRVKVKRRADRPPVQTRTMKRLTFMMLLSFLSLCLAMLLVRVDVNFRDTVARHNGIDKECKDSCKSVLKSREYDLATSNLASSALDAIFSLHEHEGEDEVDGDEEGNRDSTTRPSRRYQQEASGTDEESTRTRTLNNSENVRNNDTTMNNNGTHQNLGHRPKRLPHLIDTLVGNIDGLVDKKRKRPRVIHHERKRSKNSGEMEMVRQNIKNHAGDSVARVAAAAAAAVISESELSSRWGSSRMKSQNDEWEEALKWISTWGPQNQNDSSSRDATSQSNQKQNRNRNDNERQVNYSYNQRGEEQGREGMKWRRKKAGEASSNFDQLFEVCVEQCLGDSEREWMPDGDHTSSGVISSIKTSMGSPVVNGLSSYFGFPNISISFRYSSTAVRKGIRNIFATMLSAAVLWFLQSVYGWWTLSKYTTSLEILLQEESKNEGKEAHGKRPGKRRTGRKKSKQRKKKGHHRSVRTHRPDNHVHQSKSTDDMNWNPSEDEDSDSDDSFDRIYLMRSGTKHASTYAVDSHSDQASKGTISTASWTTFDSGRTQSSDPNFNLAQDPTGNHQSDKSLLKCKPNEFDPRGRWTSINLAKSPVPTDAQREQEYQKLRIFQETQLQKLIENRKKAKALNEAKEKKMLVKDQYLTPKMKSTPLINGHEKTLPHPPGLSTNITSGAGKVKKSFTEAVTGEDPVEANAVDLLLSNLLDEGEEEVVSVSSSVKKRSEVTTNTYLGQKRSIALGDLVLGSGESPSRGSPSLMIANPWQNQPRNYTGFDTNSSFSLGVPEEVPRSASSDANVQLQVSATEFMPQWGEGNQASVNTRIW